MRQVQRLSARGQEAAPQCRASSAGGAADRQAWLARTDPPAIHGRARPVRPAGQGGEPLAKPPQLLTRPLLVTAPTVLLLRPLATGRGEVSNSHSHAKCYKPQPPGGSHVSDRCHR
jgi:hypothetical protein